MSDWMLRHATAVHKASGGRAAAFSVPVSLTPERQPASCSQPTSARVQLVMGAAKPQTLCSNLATTRVSQSEQTIALISFDE